MFDREVAIPASGSSEPRDIGNPKDQVYGPVRHANSMHSVMVAECGSFHSPHTRWSPSGWRQTANAVSVLQRHDVPCAVQSMIRAVLRKRSREPNELSTEETAKRLRLESLIDIVRYKPVRRLIEHPTEVLVMKTREEDKEKLVTRILSIEEIETGLFIGNIELNPGPRCWACNLVVADLRAHKTQSPACAKARPPKDWKPKGRKNTNMPTMSVTEELRKEKDKADAKVDNANEAVAAAEVQISDLQQSLRDVADLKVEGALEIAAKVKVNESHKVKYDATGAVLLPPINCGMNEVLDECEEFIVAPMTDSQIREVVALNLISRFEFGLRKMCNDAIDCFIESTQEARKGVSDAVTGICDAVETAMTVCAFQKLAIDADYADRRQYYGTEISRSVEQMRSRVFEYEHSKARLEDAVDRYLVNEARHAFFRPLVLADTFFEALDGSEFKSEICEIVVNSWEVGTAGCVCGAQLITAPLIALHEAWTIEEVALYLWPSNGQLIWTKFSVEESPIDTRPMGDRSRAAIQPAVFVLGRHFFRMQGRFFDMLVESIACPDFIGDDEVVRRGWFGRYFKENRLQFNVLQELNSAAFMGKITDQAAYLTKIFARVSAQSSIDVSFYNALLNGDNPLRATAVLGYRFCSQEIHVPKCPNKTLN